MLLQLSNILEDSQVRSLIISIVTLFLTFLGARKGVKAYNQYQLKKMKNLIPTASKIKQVIRSQVSDDRTAALLFGQAYHETGGFTSGAFSSNLNLFGMKPATTRPTEGSRSVVSPYAYYNSYASSVRDLILWFDYHNASPHRFTNVEDYVRFLKSKGYFTDSEKNYLRGVKYGVAKYYETV